MLESEGGNGCSGGLNARVTMSDLVMRNVASLSLSLSLVGIVP